MPSKSNEKGPPKRPLLGRRYWGGAAKVNAAGSSGSPGISGSADRRTGDPRRIGPSSVRPRAAGSPFPRAPCGSPRAAWRCGGEAPVGPAAGLGLPALEMDIAALGPHAGLQHQGEADGDEYAARARDRPGHGDDRIIRITPRTNIVHSTTGWSMKRSIVPASTWAKCGRRTRRQGGLRLARGCPDALGFAAPS